MQSSNLGRLAGLSLTL